MSLNEARISRSSTTTTTSRSRKILPTNATPSTDATEDDASSNPLVTKHALVPLSRPRTKSRNIATAIIRSLLGFFPLPALFPTCRWLTEPSGPSSALGRRVTGTLFGQKKGHVSFAVQEGPRSEPVLLLELATSTNSLVKEMGSGLVRIALECERGPGPGPGHVRLFQEPLWTMYCNGRKSGYAVSRKCGEPDLHVLSTVQTVSVGAGVLPRDGSDGDLIYMRAKFDRVVGSRDSEAFYMISPDGNGGPELSVFLLRI